MLRSNKQVYAACSSGECPIQAVLNSDMNGMLCSLQCARPPPLTAGSGRRVFIWQKNFKVGKGAQVENLLFYWLSAQASTLGVFFFKQYAPGHGTTNLQKILRLNFSYETNFQPIVLLLKKAARFHKHLRLKRSSLLSSYLFFSLFN